MCFFLAGHGISLNQGSEFSRTIVRLICLRHTFFFFSSSSVLIDLIVLRKYTGNLFLFPHHLTWEFTSHRPVRSVFPLWPVYGFPMVVLRWVWTETGKEDVAPVVIYYTLRVLMFILSFVLEDWAIHELIYSPRHRKLAVFLVASSYVTWTYQTHTFSNSVETLVVAWSLVMIQRILENKVGLICFQPDALEVLYSCLSATILTSDLRSSWLSCCIWHFQPHHIPCLSFPAWSVPCSTLFSKVSCSPPTPILVPH